MAFEYKRLTEITTLGSTASSVLANPSGKTSYIRLIIIHNTNTSTETVELYCVPDSSGSVGTAGDSNKFFKKDLQANETYIIELAVPGIVLEDTNDTIQGKSTTAGEVTIQIYGGQE